MRWQFAGEPDGATACNCMACRRYGVLWAIDDFDGLDTFTDLPRDGGLRRRLPVLTSS